eukprot:1160990-Pelagomonas_calceolata.AAC.9
MQVAGECSGPVLAAYTGFLSRQSYISKSVRLEGACLLERSWSSVRSASGRQSCISWWCGLQAHIYCRGAGSVGGESAGAQRTGKAVLQIHHGFACGCTCIGVARVGAYALQRTEIGGLRWVD